VSLVVKGQLVWIGSDALPPDQIRPFYSFPAKVQIDNSHFWLMVGKFLAVRMSVSANIKLRQRTVMSIFNLFSKKMRANFVR